MRDRDLVPQATLALRLGLGVMFLTHGLWLKGADRRPEPLQRADGVRLSRSVLENDGDRIVSALHRFGVDTNLAQRAARLAKEALHALLDQGAGVDLEHEMGAAAQV